MVACRRREIWWANLPERLGYDRPVLIVQDDQLDRSKVNSVLVIPLTTNLDRSKYPYSVLLPRVKTGLARESVAMTLQLSVIFKIDLDRQLGHVPDDLMEEIDIAMMTVLGLMP